MTSSTKGGSTVALIKGYNALRLSFPDKSGDTFVFVKDHVVASASSGTHDGEAGTTLFVTNVPFVPGVHSRLFLSSLFGRFGRVDKVRVVQNPRTANESMLEDPNRALWEHATSSYHHFLDDPYSGQGKFAHVIFASPKAKKQALKTMQKMNKDTNIIAFGALELQQLSDESKRMHAKEMSKKDDDDESNADSDQENSDEDVQSDSLTGIMALADRFRSCSQVDRSDLMNACNEIMSEFEESEEAERKARMATAEPDEDGFVTVSYTGVSAGSKRELESSGGDAEASSGNNGRRRANKRSRTKKKGEGASELKDFYRFQMKENRKRGIQDLRKRFEEDLAKVKKLKEEKQYRPF